MQRHIIYGFAIFSMFFGSGNLVFPLQIGQSSGNFWFAGFLGLFLTGIFLPFLGLLVIKLYRGSYTAFFGEAGKTAQFILPLFTLSLLGSFGVIPRCITVAHGGMEQIFPGLSLVAFSLFFSAATFIFCLRNTTMIQALGKYLTPILLIALIILIGSGLVNAPQNFSEEISFLKGFSSGFITGYQTMDLFAAFFFSALIFNHIHEMTPYETDQKIILKNALSPSIIGAGILAAIYLGFVYLGAHYAYLTAATAPEALLSTIAAHVLGEKAAILIALIVIISCLTTAVALNNIYAEYLCGLFKIRNDYFYLVALACISISFVVSLLDFQGIASFLSPALALTYPALIALTLMGIFIKQRRLLKVSIFYILIFLMIVLNYY